MTDVTGFALARTLWGDVRGSGVGAELWLGGAAAAAGSLRRLAARGYTLDALSGEPGGGSGTARGRAADLVSIRKLRGLLPRCRGHGAAGGRGGDRADHRRATADQRCSRDGRWPLPASFGGGFVRDRAASERVGGDRGSGCWRLILLWRDFRIAGFVVDRPSGRRRGRSCGPREEGPSQRVHGSRGRAGGSKAG